jgi:hypothetical protein
MTSSATSGCSSASTNLATSSIHTPSTRGEASQLVKRGRGSGETRRTAMRRDYARVVARTIARAADSLIERADESRGYFTPPSRGTAWSRKVMFSNGRIDG